jgi:acetylornithine deacetylase/succinyl-diaminopimelate desuccinylase-like protein
MTQPVDLDRVDAARLCDLTLELVRVESPTGDTAEVARLFARRLEELGLEVEVLDEAFPATPIVIGRLRGDRPGPTVVLNGHLDTVPIPHAPPHVSEGVIFGRGSADMKGALACAAETARLVCESGSFPGELVVLATGLHESPGGRGEDLAWLLYEHGFRADAAVVCELGGDAFVAAHAGCATFEIVVGREGMVTHELKTATGTPHPIMAAGAVLAAIGARNAELAGAVHPLVGSETFFVGEIEGGDFYNRFPTTCRLVGTRRWLPGNRMAAVEADFRELLAGVANETGCSVELDLRLVREGYEIDPEHPLSLALRRGYADVTGEELPIAGGKLVADAAFFNGDCGIPAVYHGPLGSGAHGDIESVPVAELVRATKVYLRMLERVWA